MLPCGLQPRHSPLPPRPPHLPLWLCSLWPLPPHLQKEDLLRMERIMLDTLSWHVKTPTAYTFLHLYTQAQAQPAQPHVTATAAYLIELGLLEFELLAWTPSQVAAAALLLAQSWCGPARVGDVRDMSGEWGHLGRDGWSSTEPPVPPLPTPHTCGLHQPSDMEWGGWQSADSPHSDLPTSVHAASSEQLTHLCCPCPPLLQATRLVSCSSACSSCSPCIRPPPAQTWASPCSPCCTSARSTAPPAG